MTWSDASEQCKEEGGELTSIRGVRDQAFLTSLAALIQAEEDESAWIGLNDIGAPGSYYWKDRAFVTYTNWAPGEPSDLFYVIPFDFSLPFQKQAS